MTVADNDGAQEGQDDANTSAQDGLPTGETLGDGHESGQEGEVVNDEVIVTIGEEAPPSEEAEDEPGLVNKLRRMNREKERELRELRQKAAAPVPEIRAQTIAKPSLEDCNFEEEVYESKLLAWHEQQAKVKAEQQSKVNAEKAQSDAWNATLESHGKAKAALKVPDYEEAEDVVASILSVTQRGIIISGADDSAKVEYALGKNPAKAKELASIKDPVKFAFAVSKLETQLKVTTRKAPPPPETRVRGSTAVAIGGDAELDRLRAAAEKSGDMSHVMAYKAKKRAA
mgnify:CR=1 FL=1